MSLEGADSANAGMMELVRDVSLAGRGVSPEVFLQRVCTSVARGFDYDRVTALRFDPGAEEPRKVAAYRYLPAEQQGNPSVAEEALLIRARDSRHLVLATDDADGGITSLFALPLVGDGRCLGLLSGSRRGAASSDAHEADGLATVGVVASTLLEDALALEEARELDVLKSEFIALAAHELRNPVSSIYGLCVTLYERGDALAEPDRLTLRDALREQTTRMRRLIEQLLDLSRFDLRGIQVAPQRVRLRPRIEELVRTVVPAGEGPVKIVVSAELEAAVDPVSLDRMLSNLIANALRHGEPPVTVTAAERDTHLRVTVEDRGQGVRREFVPRLFDRFARDPEARGHANGSGLGLAIAQAYARAHGGDIVYEGAVPHGARFELVIPLRAPERDKPHRSR
jgi:signal transduction histidine kinase